MTSLNLTTDWHEQNWDEHNARFTQWVQGDAAREVFQATDQEIQTQVESFQKGTIINPEELQKPFTI